VPDTNPLAVTYQRNATNYTFHGAAIADSLNINQLINSAAQKIIIQSKDIEITLVARIADDQYNSEYGDLLRKKILSTLPASAQMQTESKSLFDSFRSH